MSFCLAGEDVSAEYSACQDNSYSPFRDQNDCFELLHIVLFHTEEESYCVLLLVPTKTSYSSQGCAQLGILFVFSHATRIGFAIYEKSHSES